MGWPDLEQDKALAWLAEQRTRCPGCGHPRHISQDPALANEWEPVVDRCFSCETRERQKAAMNEDGGGNLAGLYISAQRRSVVPGLARQNDHA